MPDGGVSLDASVKDIEAPVTVKAYILCAFAGIGGMFLGYDYGYINGVTGTKAFIKLIEGPGKTLLSSSHNSLIISILSAGIFFGALVSGDIADWYGRRPTIFAGCCFYIVGCALQVASSGLALIVVGRLVAGVGVGFVSAIAIVYISDVSPRKVRGSFISVFFFCITVGVLLASCVTYATESRTDAASYRIPISLQFIWGFALGISLYFLPESPRYFVQKGKIDSARAVLSRLRGQPEDSEYIAFELGEIVVNAEHEKEMISINGYWSCWLLCFTGSLWEGSSNVRRTILGTTLHLMQQLTGLSFVFYYSTPFLESTGAISNPFFIFIIFTLVGTLSNPISFWAIEKIGRRPLLIWSAFGMCICQFLVAIIGVAAGFNKTHLNAAGTAVANNIPAVNAQIAFIAIYVFFFASMWGPAVLAVQGEIFPLSIRSRGIALSTAADLFWGTIITVITPYMVNPDAGNLRSSVFFVWGSLCSCAFVYVYFFVPETKGLSLEQIDRMLEETTPRTSAGWVPKTTYLKERLKEKENLRECSV